MWFIGVEVEQETSAPPPKKNPGSAPVFHPHVMKLADLSSTLINLNMISEEELVLSLLEIQSDLSITYDTSSNQLKDVTEVNI